MNATQPNRSHRFAASLLLAFVTVFPASLHAEEPSFDQSVTVRETTLQRVGTGSFSWMFFKVYDGAYYQDAQNLDQQPLDNVAKRLVLQYHRKLTAKQFRKSGNGFLEKNLDSQTLDSLSDRLRKLNDAYKDVQKGDRYALTYLPGKGTTLALNGESLVTIPGQDFAQAYFSIWLGDDPVKASFRDQLLQQ